MWTVSRPLLASATGPLSAKITWIRFSRRARIPSTWPKFSTRLQGRCRTPTPPPPSRTEARGSLRRCLPTPLGSRLSRRCVFRASRRSTPGVRRARGGRSPRARPVSSNLELTEYCQKILARRKMSQVIFSYIFTFWLINFCFVCKNIHFIIIMMMVMMTWKW